MNATESCQSCRFWRRWAPSSVSPNFGDCRRYAPELVLEDKRHRTRFPSTLLDNWCGEHEAAAPPALIPDEDISKLAGGPQ